ncbi:zinc finger SWIM domain-containing protein 8-like isoform X2 [Lytechinus variegatus]|uniref:zinc finger SWIM domain-containing protein 8-like isoform X2 n=1 Tax=Lytechinus variegatus TaxID=7654 RepID=UPI001BB11AFB|nr:zinc finger SWIM domain-containing protein 8-like isoform X2 [Lytechinus variegatus]
MDFIYDWDDQGDQFSFEDSDRFEEDSLCSWVSEAESVCNNNWRGWKKNSNGTGGGDRLTSAVPPATGISSSLTEVPSLVELTAKTTALHIPFEVVERVYPPVPENLQLRIAFWSFPENEEDIRLYSCLANGSPDEFQRGEHMVRNKAVKDVLQIGFHLSGTVVPSHPMTQQHGTSATFNVAITFDRRRISSCSCTCSSASKWCSHVVALCLYRIHHPSSVCLRAPVSESLSRLHREQLQKFAQYLISEFPRLILPTAQRLLDELLLSQGSAINKVCGAPDPTAGPPATEMTHWFLDEAILHENIKKTLIRFSGPSPIVFSDVNSLYLSSTAPQAAAEWTNLLRPLRGRMPEGIWNLLSIVREMYRRRDSNAISLLRILTEECIICDQIVIWWFTTRTSALHSQHGNHGHRASSNSSTAAAQHACASMCEEIVTLWRLAALNPINSRQDRGNHEQEFRKWHLQVIEKARKARGPSHWVGAGGTGGNNNNLRKVDIEVFAGFKPAIEACMLDWSDFPIEGVTHRETRIPRVKVDQGSDSNNQPSGSNHLVKTPESSTAGTPTCRSSPECSKQEVNVVVSSSLQAESPGSKEEKVKVESDSETLLRANSSDSSMSSSSDRVEGYQTGASLSHSDDTDSDVQTVSNFASKQSSDGKHLQPHGAEIKDTGSQGSNSPREGAAAGDKPSGKRKTKSKHVDRGDSDLTDSEAGLVAEPLRREQESDSSNDARAGRKQALQVEQRESRESQPSSDEYQMYYYDTRQAKAAEPTPPKKKNDTPNPFVGIKKMEDRIEIMFSRAEALHAHGYTRHACKLAIQLAEEMLDKPPVLDAPPPTGLSNRARKKHVHSQSVLTSMTLSKAAFLCSVLSEQSECHHLAFRMGMFGLELPRQPASTKALEVKLNSQETDLVTLLKRIPLGPSELGMIRERAQKLQEGTLRSRGEALLPIMLASFIFDALCLPGQPAANIPRTSVRLALVRERTPNDEKMGFEAAVAAMAMKANVSEADHPLLCEGTRRQRGDLALAMLSHYKEDQGKFRQILDALLDKQGPKTHKTPCAAPNPINPVVSRPSQQVPTHGHGHAHNHTHPQSHMPHPQTATGDDIAARIAQNMGELSMTGMPPGQPTGIKPQDVKRGKGGTKDGHDSCEGGSDSNSRKDKKSKSRLEAPGPRPVSSGPPLTVSGNSNLDPAMCRIGQPNISQAGGGRNRGEFPTISGEDDGSHHPSTHGPPGASNHPSTTTGIGYWGRIFGRHPRKSKGMASIDSSAPETTSSDNSPTLARRVPPGGWGRYHGPGSDSGSSGNSSDSVSSSSSGERGSGARPKLREAEPSPGQGIPVSLMRANPVSIPVAPENLNENKACIAAGKANRGRKGGRNDNCPTVPNQPSEASAHFFFELAKTVLNRAGGSSSTALFTQECTNSNHSGPHRGLHLCAFEIGLYALRLHNAVTPNWLSRTYSSHVSWITGQAMEIGSAAINLLVETWEGHLTPTEAASLADRASRGRDPNMVRAAAQLALSCLSHAHALNPTDVNRALMQCKEQDIMMLQKACVAVESAAKGGDVYPEVLFNVAKQWEWLHDNSTGQGNHSNQRHQHHHHHQQHQHDSDEDKSTAADEGTGEEIGPVVPFVNAPVRGIVPQQRVVGLPYGLAQPHAVPIVYHHPEYQEYVAVDPYMARHQFGNAAHAMPVGDHRLQHRPPMPPDAHNMQWLPHHQYHGPCPYNANVAMPGMAVSVPRTAFQPTQVMQLPPGQAMAQRPIIQYPMPPTIIHARPNVIQQQQQQQHPVQPIPNMAQPIAPQQHPGLFYLHATYRVGMLGIDTLARRVHDERTQSRFSPNPPYGEDIKWLMEISKRLGVSYVQQFCACVLSVVVSPFVLHTITWEAAHYLASMNHTSVQANLRSPILSPIVQKCVQMYIQCIHQRMYHITPPEYDDFISVVQSAQKAFSMQAGGQAQFKDFIQSLRRLPRCKHDLWVRLSATLSPSLFEHSSSSSASSPSTTTVSTNH